MRNVNTRTKTLKKKLKKCKNIFYAYNDIQFRFGDVLDSRSDVVEIKCNVRIDCELGDNFTTDFYVVKNDGSIMVRECVYKNSLLKPMNIKLLDASRNYWISKGISDWGIVLDEK